MGQSEFLRGKMVSLEIPEAGFPPWMIRTKEGSTILSVFTRRRLSVPDCSPAGKTAELFKLLQAVRRKQFNEFQIISSTSVH